jgi:serine/threonine protein kinase
MLNITINVLVLWKAEPADCKEFLRKLTPIFGPIKETGTSSLPPLKSCDMMLNTNTAFVHILMELCSQDLGMYVRENQLISVLSSPAAPVSIMGRLACVLDILHQIASGLVFIHKNDEIHRDLKLENDNF